MNTKILLKKLAKRFPKRLAESYDHVGLQQGKIKEEVHTIFLCLDFDMTVLKYILNNNLESKIDMIITHHPFFFGRRSVILKNDPIKKYLSDVLETLSIPIYSYHTNFDSGNPGMNDALANLLELNNIRVLSTDGCARGGELKTEMEINDFVKYALNKLNVPYGSLINEGKSTIKSVAIIGGGGWRSFKNAKEEGYDIFISGDIPHNGRRDVIANKYNFLNVPHEVENVFMVQFKKVLLEIEPNLEVLTLVHEEPPVIFER